MKMMAIFKTIEEKELYEKHLKKAFKFTSDAPVTVKGDVRVVYELTEHEVGRRSLLDAQTIIAIGQDRESGMSFGELAEKYGCPRSSIQNYVKKAKKSKQSEPLYELLDD